MLKLIYFFINLFILYLSLMFIGFTVSFIPLSVTIIFFLLPQRMMTQEELKNYFFKWGRVLLILSGVIFPLPLNSEQSIYATSLLAIDFVTITGVLTRRKVLLMQQHKQSNLNVFSFTRNCFMFVLPFTIILCMAT